MKITVYVSQVIVLYTLNVYSAVCQLYLNTAERKNKKPQLILDWLFQMNVGGIPFFTQKNLGKEQTFKLT